MQTNNHERPGNLTQACLGGFRLHYFEVYCWGTFRAPVWRIMPAGGTSLLTGRNGSGKTTLADGLQTLLVPVQRRAYNQAAGIDKRERNETTYVRGAWSRQKERIHAEAEIQYLRGKGDCSILLACFRNGPLHREVTLAQVLWYQDYQVHKLHVVAPFALTIAEDFGLRGTMADLRKQLRARGAEVYDTFSPYIEQFRRLVGLRSEKALDLFNQIISLKEIGELNSFVRDHMLEKTDPQKPLGELLANFENLARVHDMMVHAQQELTILTPLIEDGEEFAKRQGQIDDFQRRMDFLPAYGARRKRVLLQAAALEAEQILEQNQQRSSRLQERQKILLEQLVEVKAALQNDAVGRLLDQLEQQCVQIESMQGAKRERAKTYNRLTRAADLPSYSDEETFADTMRQARVLLEKSEGQLGELRDQRDAWKKKEHHLESACQSLERELRSLRGRTSNISNPEVELRRDLLAALHLTEDQLPFAGELLRVRDSAADWQGAIERLLRGFAHRLLVPEEHYQQVSRYVETTDLMRRRLVYHRVGKRPKLRHNSQPDDELLFWKLEVKKATPFTDWLTSELIEAFDYVCCETLDEFRYAQRALTKNGHIKHTPSRHEKDDRTDLADTANYALGWDNSEKQRAIAQKYTQQKHDLDAVREKIGGIEESQRQEQARQQVLHQILDFGPFESLNWKEDEKRKRDIQERQRSLRASANHLSDLDRQKDQITAELASVQDELGQTQGTIQSLGKELETNKRQQEACRNTLEQEGIRENPDLMESLDRDLQQEFLTLETISAILEKWQRSYDQNKTALQQLQGRLRDSIIARMVDFKQLSPESTQDVDASLQSLDDYRQIYERVRYDDLPTYQAKFKELLNEKVTISIGLFKAELETAVKDIQARIRNLNKHLSAISYTPGTYIRLCDEPSDDGEITHFQQSLRACIPDVAQVDSIAANESSFQRIALLIERFKHEDRWSRKVLDVRNWLNFAAEECYREDDRPKQWYSDSSGLSGGQKTKLAYTILASAIAYQYGLDQAEASERSFRFMVIDEAFCRSDEENVRYAMDLFAQLNLQAMVVTPLDKIHVIEPYISACHFAFNNLQGNDSKVRDMNIEEYYAGKDTLNTQGGLP